MTGISKLVSVAFAISLAATSASAQASFYIGGGIGATAADSVSAPGSTSVSDGTLGQIGLTFGVRNQSGNMFFGAELDSDLNVTGDMSFPGIGSCANGAASPYFCSHTATVRMRGILGTDVGGGTEVFGTLGYGIMYGDGAINGSGGTDSGSVAGYTVGIGAQRPIANGTGRLELIYDDFDNIQSRPEGLYDPTWEATTLKASYLISF